MSRRWWSGCRGSAIVEALIAAAVVVSLAAGVAILVVRSRQAIVHAGLEVAAVAAAQQKLEQLLALDWRYDAAGARRSDGTTDLSADPPAPGGSGLQPTPADALDRNLPGSTDFVAADGSWRGGGTEPIAGTALIRRWSIAPHAPDAADTLLLTVAVFGVDGATRPIARVQTLRTRTAR